MYNLPGHQNTVSAQKSVPVKTWARRPSDLNYQLAVQLNMLKLPSTTLIYIICLNLMCISVITLTFKLILYNDNMLYIIRYISHSEQYYVNTCSN